jgi:hypothetical protein
MKYNEYKQNRKKINFNIIKELNYINSNVNIAIIVPERNRLEHLQKFINWINKLNKLSNHNFDIYIINQNNFDKFNRGILLNIGYYIAKKNKLYQRYILHDVDSYPDQDLFNLYFSNLDKNIHFASPHLGYKYNFENFLGGVFGIKPDDFEKINGFPNNFFGWGGEDDSFYNRLAINNIKVYRPSKGKYYLEEHDKPKPNELNKKKQKNILFDLQNWKNNGIKQLDSLYINYKFNELEDFIENYEINNPNYKNNAELLYKYKLIKKSVSIYKIDFLVLHNEKEDKLLLKNYVDFKIKNKSLMCGSNCIHHKIQNKYMSYIEPLIYWDEIKEKIINTFTKPKKFTLNIITNKRTNKIKNILKEEFSFYKNNLKLEDLENTIKFIFETYNEIIYIRIRNNKIECKYHIYSEINKINWFKNLKYKSKPINESIINILEDIKKPYYTIKNPNFTSTNNCLLGLDSYNYFEGIPFSYIQNFIEMINYTIKYFKIIPDCDILINRKDFSYLRKDNKYSYINLLDEKIKEPLKKYWVIGCQSKQEINLDIPIPSADEWAKIKENNKYKIKWSNKKSIAIFRGSSTGCGTNETNNKRLKLVSLSNKNNLDVALTTLTGKMKVYNQNIYLTDFKKYEKYIGSFLDGTEQSKYKYIFNIEGNSQAYRYSTEFAKQSIILNVKSEYYMWFNKLIIKNKHFIEIDSNYNNLQETITYLIINDNKAEKIAHNGYKFYKKYINKKMIAYYWFYYMYNINQLNY